MGCGVGGWGLGGGGVCSALGPLGVSTLYTCSTCSLYIDLYVALQSAIDLIHLAQDLAAQYCIHCHRKGVHRCRSHTDRTRVTAWCFDQVQFSQLPLLGELTPQSGSGACVSCFALVDFAFVLNRPIFRTGDNQVSHLSENN